MFLEGFQGTSVRVCSRKIWPMPLQDPWPDLEVGGELGRKILSKKMNNCFSMVFEDADFEFPYKKYGQCSWGAQERIWKGKPKVFVQQVIHFHETEKKLWLSYEGNHTSTRERSFVTFFRKWLETSLNIRDKKQ